MSISELIVKVIGIILAVFGLIILLTNVTGLIGTWVICLVGLGLLVLGIYIIRGGTFTI
jgi:hypothetical protein